METTIELKVEPARSMPRWFGDQGKRNARQAREKPDQAIAVSAAERHRRAATSDWISKRPSSTSFLPSSPSFRRKTADAQSKQQSGSAATRCPRLVQNPLIQSLKAEIARQEAKLQEIAGNFGKNHPQYRAWNPKLLRSGRNSKAEMAHITSGFSTSSTVGKNKEAELRAAIEAQKKLAARAHAERAPNSPCSRATWTRRKRPTMPSPSDLTRPTSTASPRETNVTVLTPAAEPIEPSFPKTLLNMLIAIFLGTMLGVGAAFMFEMLRPAHPLGRRPR